MGREGNKQKDAAGSGLKSCQVCCEPIKIWAQKCIKCGSYQDWTRHLLRWSTLLVSLLALAPLWSLSGSVSKLAFAQKKAIIEAAVTACSYDEVRVAFENSGELSGIVTGVDFSVKQGADVRAPDGTMRNRLAEGDILVMPGKEPVMASYQAFIDGEPTNIISELFAQQDCSYLLNIRWTDFSGAEQQLVRECRCR